MDHKQTECLCPKYCPLFRPHISARPMLFGSRGPSELFVSDTSPKIHWPRRPEKTPFRDQAIFIVEELLCAYALSQKRVHWARWLLYWVENEKCNRITFSFPNRARCSQYITKRGCSQKKKTVYTAGIKCSQRSQEPWRSQQQQKSFSGIFICSVLKGVLHVHYFLSHLI